MPCLLIWSAPMSMFAHLTTNTLPKNQPAQHLVNPIIDILIWRITQQLPVPMLKLPTHPTASKLDRAIAFKSGSTAYIPLGRQALAIEVRCSESLLDDHCANRYYHIHNASVHGCCRVMRVRKMNRGMAHTCTCERVRKHKGNRGVR
jgi:hypothetical protein